MKILKFSAIWCPACLIMNQVWEKIATEYNLEIDYYDYDMNKEEVNKYNIGKILPVIILMDEDEEIERFIGEYSHKYLSKVMDNYEKQNN